MSRAASHDRRRGDDHERSILPSLYHMQRQGTVGEISICGRRARPLKELASPKHSAERFPGRHSSHFRASMATSTNPIRTIPPDYCANAADEISWLSPCRTSSTTKSSWRRCEARSARLRCQAAGARGPGSLEIEREAHARGLVVGVEYHKRFDDRALLARRRYREGLFGEFRWGRPTVREVVLSPLQFPELVTAENSDAFSYIGCHYVDQVHFITGLLPAAVSVYGIRDRFPNGNEGFLWTDARVIWNNGACLNVQNALGFPDAAPGSNTQGLIMYCRGRGRRVDHPLRPVPRHQALLYARSWRRRRNHFMPSQARTTSNIWT